ncbi:undecaprenyldiphospho-muramoylpentapeptide beta-N-acetylglucosaminyltransferase [Caulobacter mirabilis]|uniref:UDP-N-acetylglucosamine--N-acetylmuramyl-(pentapeptide) pyrophosphoryl-undecaprenol N-acetylglucosamine transferase n=1 Tax=Caulobacter mirabilis TaxID=69666 RepID=A0A2D2B0L9_9CAUL|nr:undecaprenyldiphospho-muramoylpentapeptide beta-N-acetylglucosaminyltransferase [Caulobacter mirabilis]ATQ43800.1 undecaprenyldiphospho-muramoylpentapeptide beta-N-acetylglucosaminyltransferase [Caulobacter mirabilis]
MPARLAVVAAGGTGGHLFPAQALAEELIRRGWRIVLATDERGALYADKFPADQRIALSAATARPGDPIGMLKAGWAVLQGTLQAGRAFKQLDPAVVVGFGGYPSLPGLLAGIAQRRPTVIHEQNAVFGRVNRFIAGRVDAVACAFPTLQLAKPAVASRTHVVGNPVRPDIRALYGVPYEAPAADGPIRILVTGGSQGARLLSELTPEAIAKLPEDLRVRIEVQQQTRKESMDIARRTYANAMVKAEVAPFFRDMAGRLKTAHLVIGRAGASTVCELAVAGKPSVLVPLAVALDDHQTYNAKLLADAGAAAICPERELTVDTLAGALNALLKDPDWLARMAAGAKSVARPDAAERLADLVEDTAR